MALSDPEIERFSRQIIVPEIGAVGQERLRRSAVALAGGGTLAEIAAVTIAGLGIGRIVLHREAAGLRADLAGLDPDLEVTLSCEPLGANADCVLVACDLGIEEIDRAGATGWPLIAAGASAVGGWLVAAGTGGACAGCAARQAMREVTGVPACGPLAGAAAVAVGSLTAIAVLRRCLGIGAGNGGEWLSLDAATPAVARHAIERAPGCPAHWQG